MSCNTCQSKFSFFTRENGCPNCGFSYCSKCLKYKCQLSDNTVKKVCGPCYNKLMSDSRNSSENPSTNESPSQETCNTLMAPVDIEHKINALDNPVKPPIIIYKQGRWDKFKAGLDPADQAIVDRLRKLKDEDKRPPPPTTEEIRRRLALLKDEDPDQVQPTNIRHVDRRSDQEKSDDLIRQYLETLELSSTSDSTGDMEERLNKLKGINPPKSLSMTPDDDCDDETVTKKIIEKAIAEAALEAKYDDEELEEMEIEAPKENSDDDSSCVMCEQTKDLVQCTGCTGDLYCLICFEDNHDDFEMKKHKAVPFTERKRVPY
ncbi:hypothetical protein PV327_008295 [Microctonus hyperodae]|uniref:FYVE-type domain-containing protein n=1 Tax=Microctonus hyperodae TaxID=165561 RepID=A0AA39KH63_MICHY|nr:hypothetical protein PV327_008295 [Microctonus hyperodae]